MLLIPLVLVACDRGQQTASSNAEAAQPADAPLRISAMTLPAKVPAAQSDLIVDRDGRLLLSWIEPQAQGHALKLATADAAGTWQPPQTVATGTNWFVNWADTPHIAITDDGALWAHWLQKSAKATYAYDVALSRSHDGGKTWSPPHLANNDGTPTEHGFVSLWPASRDTLGVGWLDGRETAQGESPHDSGGHDEHGGAMTVRAAIFDAKLQRTHEQRLDAMACDCCQTDVALTARGPLLVFRDRTPEEIRDIATTRLQDDAWTTPRIVHADQWKMPACPVNGPSIAARGEDVVVAWYSAAGDVPTLKLARSRDAGDSFAAPVLLDRGNSVQGRVDVALGADAAWVLWLREDAQGQSLQLARYAPDLSRELQRLQVAKLEGRGRATGFPQLALGNGKAYVVWTDVIEGKPQLRGAMLTQ